MSPDGLNLAGAFNPADSRSPGERDSSAVFNRGIAVPPPGDPATFPALAAEIRALAAQEDALILAHSYERAEIQDVADHVGDSLALSRLAARSGASTIVFCGVSFMAETAKILSPGARVLLPDPAAGCSLASSISADELVRWKGEHPGAVVVSYVNTSAAVKAQSDYCCTSGNARAVIEAVPAGQQILFLPDLFLGAWLQRVTGRPLTLWPGECHVHAGIKAADVAAWQRAEPGAELLIHPECGCASPVLDAAGDSPGVHILSTEGMVAYAQGSGAARFLIATETGILHRLAKLAPAKTFIPVKHEAVCPYMKLTTLEKLRDALRLGQYEVSVPPEVAARARLALERMIAIA
jgi:quinolinate synthase